MAYTDPLVDVAIRKASKGHRDWLIWRDKKGRTCISAATADAYKAAMLATGTQKSFTLVSGNSAHFHRMTWRLAVTAWRNTRRYGFA
jgi:hypothetical protein